MMKNNEYIFFIESEIFDITNQEDINFLREFVSENQSLIEQEGDKYRINFVGEVITPTNRYFSMPKNMQPDDNTVELIKEVLAKYRKDETGKNLVLSQLGSYNSERVYFDKLKSYFLDFLTYEFIYPLKRKKIHSNSPVSGAKVSVFDTIRNRKRFGTGITYTTKDVENSDDWILDDIYFYTIKELEERLNVSPTDKSEIEKMREYLISEGYSFNKLVDNRIISNKTGKQLLDLSDTLEVIKKIKSCEIGIIHNPIKNVLLEYYGNKQDASSNLTVNVIFTKNFEKVWEMILQDALRSMHIEEFGGEKFVNSFNKYEVTEKFIPTSQLSEYSRLDIIEDDSESDKDKWISKRGNRYFLCVRGRKLIPDIFVELENGKRFIGDAKYYKDTSDSNYDKEFYIYNDAQNNEYPMVVFAIPDSENQHRTKVPRNGYRRARIENGVRELIIITVCVTDVINDAIRNGDKVLNDSIHLISKYTRKPSWYDEN